MAWCLPNKTARRIDVDQAWIGHGSSHVIQPTHHHPRTQREDDKNWPEPDRVGKQELEIRLGDEHIRFTVRYGDSLSNVVLGVLLDGNGCACGIVLFLICGGGGAEVLVWEETAAMYTTDGAPPKIPPHPLIK